MKLNIKVLYKALICLNFVITLNFASLLLNIVDKTTNSLDILKSR